MNSQRICMFCKGNLVKGFNDFVAKVGDQVVVINQLPALICEQCGEAYYEKESMDKIEIIQKQIHSGDFVGHPLAAGEIDASEIAPF